MARENEEVDEEYLRWVPKTQLGRDVMAGKIKEIGEIFKKGLKIKEPEIVDKLLPNIRSEIVLVGGSPGKGGGIRRTPTKRTARMHKSGRRYKISAIVVVGDDGYIGVGKASGIDHRQAIEKATTEAKLNVIPVKRGCGSWECGCGEKHSIPFEVSGKIGSLRVVLKPAPKGIGLCISDEMKKMFQLSGVKDIWSKTFGNTRTRGNYVFAIYNAFKNLNKIKTLPRREPQKQEGTKKSKRKTEKKE